MEVVVVHPDQIASLDDADLSDSFDIALAHVQDLQRAHYLVTRSPLSIVTRESTVPMLPMAVGRGQAEGFPVCVTPVSLFMANVNLWHHSAEPPLEGQQREQLRAAIDMVQGDAAFSGYLDAMREAELACFRRGDQRSAAIFSASGAETLLDELLLHLLWEEEVAPADAASIFSDPRRGVAARVSASYAPRIGGAWAADREGPVRGWANEVAALRHRAVHGGYRPSGSEARASIDAVRSLEKLITARLTSKPVLAKYPRTALALVGQPGLERRGLWQGQVRKLAEDSTQPTWKVHYARWRGHVERRRLNVGGEPPNLARSLLLLVVCPNGATRWVVHDPESSSAALVADPVLTAPVRDSLAKTSATLHASGLERAVSVAVPHPSGGVSVVGPWTIDSDLVPEAAVMPTWSDTGLR